MKIELVVIKGDGTVRGVFSEREAIDPAMFQDAVGAYFVHVEEDDQD